MFKDTTTRPLLFLILVVFIGRTESATFTVTSTSDSGNGSFRQAIADANGNAGADTIHFNIPGTGPHTIQLNSALPFITGPVLINGYTQSGAQPNARPLGSGLNTVLMIELSGANAGLHSSGLILKGGHSSVAGLVINGFNGNGIAIESDSNFVQGNFIGTDPGGTTSHGNDLAGILVYGGAQWNMIGGLVAETTNLIGGNGGNGVTVLGDGAHYNTIQRNFIGTGKSGAQAVSNHGNGVAVSNGPAYTVVMENLISGNSLSGISLADGCFLSTVWGNRIGTDITGSVALGNAQHGIIISASNENEVGDAVPSGRNLISGNSLDGIMITGGARDNLVSVNFIGTDSFGMSPLGNRNGVSISGASDNIIGTSVANIGNIISGNDSCGVKITGTLSSGNVVQCNSIGTDSTRIEPLDLLHNNNTAGVLISGAPQNIIGGGTPIGDEGIRRNIITGNQGYGVYITGSSAAGNAVAGNSIGYGNETGDDNFLDDLFIEGAPGNYIVSNDFSYNYTNRLDAKRHPHLIRIEGTGAQGNKFHGNNLTGNGASSYYMLGGDGITITDAPQTLIGGTGSGEGNQITGVNHGVQVTGATATGTIIQGNSISGCGGYGAYLESDSNDIGGDVSGAGNTFFRNHVGVCLKGNGNTIQGNSVLESVWFNQLNQIIESGTGIKLEGNDNLLGGISPAERNVISGTMRYTGFGGVAVEISGQRNLVEGNFIGTTTDGMSAYHNSYYIWQVGTAYVDGNEGPGIYITGSNNFIGGITGTSPGDSCTGACNVIAYTQGGGVSGNGVYIPGYGNTIQGNHIGTDVTGTVPLGHFGDGISISGSNNLIGGQLSGEGNIIANSKFGLTVTSGVRNSILSNSIFSNDFLGIDMVTSTYGITQNDSLDADTGPNTLQNYPLITAANVGSGSCGIAGTLRSTPKTLFAIELFSNSECDTSGYGEGERFIGSDIIRTDGSGTALFKVICSTAVVPGHYVTATATDSLGNTSEFSPCIEAQTLGACCTAQGACTTATADQCSEMEGTYQGDGTICLGDEDNSGIDDACEIAPGDVGGDGSIDVLDVLAVINHILGGIPLQGGSLGRADCNGDGKVDILDALGIVNVILGIGTCSP